MKQKLHIVISALAACVATATSYAADSRISEMPAATSVTGSDYVPIIQGGSNKTATFAIQKDLWDSYYTPIIRTLTINGTTFDLSANRTWTITTAADDLHYVTTQAEAGLSHEFSLGSLASGLLKIAVSSGIAAPATAIEGTDYLGTARINNTAFASSWDSDITHAPSKNAVYDYVHQFDTDDDGKVNVLDIAAGIPKTNSSGVVSLATEGSDYLDSARISDTAYDATTWNGDTTHAPSKNAVRDEFEAVIAGAGSVSDTAFASSWNGVTTIAPSKNAVYDWGHTFDTDDDGKVNVLDMGAGIVKTDAGGVVSAASEGSDYLDSTRIDDTAYNAITWDADTTHAPSKNAVRDEVQSLISSVGGSVDDTAFASSWNGVTITAPSKNAVYDWGHTFDTDDDGKVNVLDMAAGIVKTDSGGVVSIATEGSDYLDSTRISDTAYDATTWNGDTTHAPSKNAVRDEIETIVAGSGSVSDTAFASSWNGVTTTAPSKNAVYDEIHLFDTADDGSIINAGTGFRIAGAAASGKILVGNGTNYVASTPTYPNAASTAGKVIVSDGTNFVTSTPTFPNASATSGKFIRSDGTNWIASTPTLPTSAGSAGKILASDGTNYIESTPTFPYSASATSGKIIKSDGTNWVASTETYAAPGTSGNVLTSDGTNWTSAAASGGGGTTSKVSGSNFTEAAGALTNITGLTFAAAGSKLYEVDVLLKVQQTTTGGMVFALAYSGTATGQFQCFASGGVNASGVTYDTSAVGTAITTTRCTAANTDFTVTMKCMLTTTNTGNITVQMQRFVGGTATCYIGSRMTVTQM